MQSVGALIDSLPDALADEFVKVRQQVASRIGLDESTLLPALDRYNGSPYQNGDVKHCVISWRSGHMLSSLVAAMALFSRPKQSAYIRRPCDPVGGRSGSLPACSSRMQGGTTSAVSVPLQRNESVRKSPHACDVVQGRH